MDEYSNNQTEDKTQSKFKDYYLNNGNTEEARREYDRIVEDMQYRKKSEANGLQIAALVMSILSIVTCCCYGIFGMLFAILGIIFAAFGNKKSTSGVGTAALIISIIGLIISTVFLVYIVLSVSSFMKSMPDFDFEDMEQIKELMYQMISQYNVTAQ